MTSHEDDSSDALVRAYRRDGVACVPGLIPAELVARILADVDAVLDSDIVGRWNSRFHYWRGSADRPERIEPVVDVSSAANEAARHRGLIRLVSRMVGDSPCLLKDKVVLAPPGGTGYEVHQDYVFYPFGNPNGMIAVAIALDRTSSDNGALQMCPGQTSRSWTNWQPRSLSPSEVDALDREATLVEFCQEPGDALIFHSLTPHRSAANTSARCRRVLHLTFTAASMGAFYEQQRKAYRDQIPDLGAGFR